MTTIPTRLRHVSPAKLLTIGAALILGGCTGGDAQTRERSGDTTGTAAAASAQSSSATEMIASWPVKQRELAMQMIEKYGQPSVDGDRMVAWFGSGPFVKTVIVRDEVAHNFPMQHVDFLTQTVKHRVPADRLAALNEYDGSVWYHRTRGELSAQCDVEEMNVLALNLAHDVIIGKRSPADARAFYAKTAMAFKQGDKSSPYVAGLMFTQDAAAADPDTPHKM